MASFTNVTNTELLSKLSKMPKPESVDAGWEGYTEFKLDEENVEELLHCVSDYYLSLEQDEEESALSIHGWRVLAATGDLALVSKFVTLWLECELIDDDWLANDFPQLMGRFGMPALPVLLEGVQAHPESDLGAGVGEALPKMVVGEEDRLEAIGALVTLLKGKQFDRDFRAQVISSLVNLKAVERIAEIREQFEGNRVNVEVGGDLEEVEMELGLRDTRSTPAKNWMEEEVKLAKKERIALAGPFPKSGSLEEKLQYFLTRYGEGGAITAVDELDGYLLALVIGGVKLSDGELSVLIWGSRVRNEVVVPPYETQKEELIWHQCLRELWNRTEAGLEEGTYEPHLSIWPDAEQSMDPEAPYFTPWLDGFMAGEMITGKGHEDPDFDEGPSLGYLAFEMIEQEETGQRLLEDSEENPFFDFMEQVQSLYCGRVDCSVNVFDREESLDLSSFDPNGKDSAGRSAPKKKAKIERNSPCPCGSGRKYKKCCMN